MSALAMPAPTHRPYGRAWEAALPPWDRLAVAIWARVILDLTHGHRPTWTWLLSDDFDWCAAVTLPGVDADGLRERLLREYWRGAAR